MPKVVLVIVWAPIASAVLVSLLLLVFEGRGNVPSIESVLASGCPSR